MGKGDGGLGRGGIEYGVSVGVWESVLGCGRVYGVSVEGVRKCVKCIGVWKDVRKRIGECVGKCVEVWGEVRDGVRRGVGGVKDAVECGGCGKVC